MRRSGTLLETARLQLFPLTRAEHLLLLDDIRVLEKYLDLRPGTDDFPPEFYDAMQWLYREGEGRGDNHWFTYWQIVCTGENAGVGGACFKGMPDADGNVEVGYGIYEGFRGRGFMQEALGALCRWALDQPGVAAVTAETDRDNIASRRVLEACGFREVSTGDGVIRWSRGVV